MDDRAPLWQCTTMGLSSARCDMLDSSWPSGMFGTSGIWPALHSDAPRTSTTCTSPDVMRVRRACDVTCGIVAES